ncbi:UbiX family flavin prenyltransferase [Sporomusa termitida]|uniref:Flavin prenyltransferase UbiX n=1 Tax=Sporomusa termitida TaxID=2377 RepID=A0A517DWZ0_9FIRM|nr:UbiX family flavin prenyltransferase [Sporomusa termitida]QDR81766.1 putative UbiX-like flavin prenyltransferase [Sporomusa termitida]
MKLIVGVSGATGIVYAIRLLEVLKQAQVEVHLVLSDWAVYNLACETDKSLEELQGLACVTYGNKELDAAIASGSFLTDGMMIVPCSMKSLAAIAHGYSDSLIVRAADVMLKEKRKLVLVPRETPLSRIHLTNMLLADQAGAIIMPPMPAFYHRPQTIEDIINHTVARILDHFGLASGLTKRWGQ